MVDDLAGVGVGVGAQSIFHTAESGAYTGAVSASMVTSLGCQYVLCGHSERRTVFKDDDEAINKKVLKVIEDGMRPVLCIGETEEEYDAGLCADVCKLQLAKDLAGVSAAAMKDVVIAYEPVWAIGTGKVCPCDVAQQVHKTIRDYLAELYDRSTADAVRIHTAARTPRPFTSSAQPDIDGCLVGGASSSRRADLRLRKYVRFNQCSYPPPPHGRRRPGTRGLLPSFFFSRPWPGGSDRVPYAAAATASWGPTGR